MTDFDKVTIEKLDLDEPKLLIIEDKITKRTEEFPAVYMSQDNRQGRKPQGGYHGGNYGQGHGYDGQSGHGFGRGFGRGKHRNQGNSTPGARKGPRCYRCNKYGHIRRNCPNEETTASRPPIA